MSTEENSNYDHLEKMSIVSLLQNINREDQTVPIAVSKCLPQIEKFISEAFNRMNKGGRLIYLGAGTSGRLGIVDASECPPTYGVSHGLVLGLIAGGDGAIRKAVEFAEDDEAGGWNDLQAINIQQNDVVVGLAASGKTPYVVGALKRCRQEKILTACITCNENTPLAAVSDTPIEVLTGPEFVTGSTRMKAGTAQKLILNMISTSLMILLGHVKGNKMVDMQLSNNKLVDRGTRLVMEKLNLPRKEAEKLLLEHGSVRKAITSKNN